MTSLSVLTKSCVIAADRVQGFLSKYRGGLFPVLSFNVIKTQPFRSSFYIRGYAAIVKSNLLQKVSSASNAEHRFSYAYQKPLLCKGLGDLPLNLALNISKADHSLSSVEVIHWAHPKYCVIAYQLENLALAPSFERKHHHIVPLNALKPSQEEHEHWEDLLLSRDNQVVTKIPL